MDRTQTPDKMKHSKHTTLDFWRRNTHHKLDTFYSLDELEKPFDADVPTPSTYNYNRRLSHEAINHRLTTHHLNEYYYFGGFVALIVYIYLCQLI